MIGETSIKLQIPGKAKEILSTLQKAGYEAYVVGGCVRDTLLGREPQDWDITTSASPKQVKGLFPRTVDTGIQHGTVTVLLGREGFEVTTYRIDGKYEDGRHPSEVTFTPDLEEDLKRRDFTINAMAYNEKDGLVDLFDGMKDIREKQIRCVGDPRERFGEDALRILRAIRFSAQLGYEIQEDTKKAVEELAGTLKKISAERIRTELVKLLVSDHPDYLRIAYETGVTAVVLPEFDRCMETEQNHPHHCYSVGEHILASLAHVPPVKELRLAMLLHDIGKPVTLTTDEKGITHFKGHAQEGERLARIILRRLKFDNDTINMVCKLVRYHDYGTNVDPDMKLVRRAIHKIGEDAFPGLFMVHRGDIYAQSTYRREEKLASQAKWEDLYQQIMEEGQCVSLKTLAVNGSDLIALGVQPGQEIGRILQRLLDMVLEDPGCNQREYLLGQAKDMITHS